MIGGLYSVATSMQTIESNQQVVAENLSHLSTPGYRRQLSSFSNVVASHNPDNGLLHHGVESGRSSTDFSAGEFQNTGRSLDFAIHGDGFFELNTPDGPRYTRSGVFFIAPDGRLVNTAGLAVASETGDIQLPANATPDRIQVSQEGEIRFDGNRIASLKVVSFEDNAALESEGAITFKASDLAIQKEDPEFRVVQGYRELSNVNATQELVKLITGVRHHEAAQKMIRTLSEMMQKRVNVS